MLFSSIPFLYYFIPCVLVLYFAVPKGLKNSVLLLASLCSLCLGRAEVSDIYAGSDCTGVCIWAFDWKISRAEAGQGFPDRLLFFFSLLLLGYCKYTDFFIANFNALTGLSVPLLRIALPIGISFYTFQALSYTVDVYRGDVPAQKNLLTSGGIYCNVSPADRRADCAVRRHRQRS